MGDRVILHSDINCCYASIEHLHHPELAGKPLAVGGDPEARHGIVLTADYIAKKYGVKTGMALWQAKQVCPDITFVSPRMDLYLRFSRMAHEIYAEYTDRQEPSLLWSDTTFGIWSGLSMEIQRIKYICCWILRIVGEILRIRGTQEILMRLMMMCWKAVGDYCSISGSMYCNS